MARLVICDDETHITDILSRYFTERGHEVFGTTSAEAALERALAHRTDLIITDISMKGISGLDLLKRIKAAALDVPVIITTGNPSHAGAVTALREGAFDYLIKPFHLEEISARAERALASKRIRAENVLYSKLVSLHSVSKSVAQASSVGDLYARVIRLGSRLTQSDAGWFFPGGGNLGGTEAVPVPPADSPEQGAFLRSLAAAAVSSGALTLTDSVDGMQGEEAWFLSLPVESAAQVLGALIFRRWKPQGRYDAVDLEVVSQLSVTFALGIRALQAGPASPAPARKQPSAAPENPAPKPRRAKKNPPA